MFLNVGAPGELLTPQKGIGNLLWYLLLALMLVSIVVKHKI